MARGDSGRVVIEVDPGLKRRLYSALAIESATLKDWFVDAVQEYVATRERKNLREAAARYNDRSS